MLISYYAKFTFNLRENVPTKELLDIASMVLAAVIIRI